MFSFARSDLGWFGKKVMVAPFERAPFMLKKMNWLGQTQFGFHLIKVTSKERNQNKLIGNT